MLTLRGGAEVVVATPGRLLDIVGRHALKLDRLALLVLDEADRLLDLGFVAFFALGAYMFGLLASPHLTDTFPAIAAMFPQGLHTPLWG